LKYYIRNSERDQITGPYEIVEIKEQLKNGTISAKSFASGDIGESVSRLNKFRRRDWTHVALLPGLEFPAELLERPKQPETIYDFWKRAFRDKLPWRLMAIGAGATTYLLFAGLWPFAGILLIKIFYLLESFGYSFNWTVNTMADTFLWFGLIIVFNSVFCFLIGLLIAIWRAPDNL
jgi:hypothetical protein